MNMSESKTACRGRQNVVKRPSANADRAAFKGAQLEQKLPHLERRHDEAFVWRHEHVWRHSQPVFEMQFCVEIFFHLPVERAAETNSLHLNAPSISAHSWLSRDKCDVMTMTFIKQRCYMHRIALLNADLIMFLLNRPLILVQFTDEYYIILVNLGTCTLLFTDLCVCKIWSVYYYNFSFNFHFTSFRLLAPICDLRLADFIVLISSSEAKACVDICTSVEKKVFSVFSEMSLWTLRFLVIILQDWPKHRRMAVTDFRVLPTKQGSTSSNNEAFVEQNKEQLTVLKYRWTQVTSRYDRL